MKKPRAGHTEPQDSILRMIDQVDRNRVSFDAAQADLAGLLDRVARNGEVTVITRRGRPAVALISAAELSSLLETVHLFASPNNARHLLDAMERADRGEGVRIDDIEAFLRSLGLDKE